MYILDFVVTIILFKSANNDVINDCRIFFNFLMPIVNCYEISRNRFEGKFIYCCDFTLLLISQRNYLGLATGKLVCCLKFI